MTRIGVANNKSPLRDAAVGFYAISDNVDRGSSASLDHEKSRANSAPTGPPTPAAEQLCMDQNEAESSKPRVVSAIPGSDTEAVMAAVEPIAISSASPCDYEPDKVGVSGLPDSTTPGIGDLEHSHRERLPGTGSHAQGGSCIEPARPPKTIVREAETIVPEAGDSNYGSVGHILQKAITGAVSTFQGIIQSQLDGDGQTIEKLRRRNERKDREIQYLSEKISLLENHSSLVDMKFKDTQELLRKANASAAELQNDIARLSNAQPELTKDDQYFMTKFAGVFFSLEGWVLQYFMHSKIDSSNLQSLPAGADLIEGLSFILGERWRAFASEETLHCIEAVATFIIKTLIFDTRMLGIFGDMFPAIEQHFGGSLEMINAWRVQTTRMIVCDKDFPSKVERRVCEVVEQIERVLGPLVDGDPKRGLARIRRLKVIIEQAAELAVECNQEPSTFTFLNYNAGWECKSSHMTDAHRAIDDEHLGDGACVKFTVSPTVLRAPKQANDEPIIILKARVVRHLKESPASEKGSETHDRDTISEITGAQLDQTLGSGEERL